MEPSGPSTSTPSVESPPQYLYHYTNYENLRKILKDGKVIQSNAKTAYVNGSGVYLTSLAPESGRNRIWWNNKGGRSNFSEIFLELHPEAIRIECYLKFDTDRLRSNVKFLKDTEQRGRDVWKLEEDILLQGPDTWYTFGFIDERGRIMAKLNQMHGKDGWKHSIKELEIDSAQETANGYYSAIANSIIRMELKDGTYHEDIGTGYAEGLSSMATILKIQAKENAIVDGLKRAAQYFGFAEDFGGTPRTPLKKYEGTPQKETPTMINNSHQSASGETKNARKKIKLCFDINSADDES
ncbi:uncharacterized protein LOC124327593 isoform X2 [Daphnia pulicaria]|uniref:uncharacterized protein LOC124327593 isoform X2 n=1 Tax=Daphnia pulicaria TaxID=35523 RepID=UPI001EECA0B3|nr:uncharacterized protein LOC124327593 isoform X2 [Daphnia pulicaria]